VLASAFGKKPLLNRVDRSKLDRLAAFWIVTTAAFTVESWYPVPASKVIFELLLPLLMLFGIDVNVTVVEVLPAGSVAWPKVPLRVYCLPKIARPLIE